jgi:hypothetical protein
MSLLTTCFNRLWAHMLTLRQQKGLDYFAMLHTDVLPITPGWVDVLVGELQKHDADVVSTVIPLKNSLGVTSTGLSDDPWVTRRLTLAEVFERPVTFTDPALVVNTGCWVAKVGPWCEKVLFRQQDRIVATKDGFRAECVPEDWDFSHQLRALGKKVYATRAVEVQHGIREWNNATPWGVWKRDEAYFEEHAQPPAP